ncbi:acylase, putative [hydrothermal vent metagenome]|uniref:Acylase, putative n=1 Tax=hydrothermal vent metagenome TaxID=652676 RepID=A0A3B0S3L5_9ZZZZ
MQRLITVFVLALVCAFAIAVPAFSKDYGKWSDKALREELARLADIQVKILVPMRDKVGLATNVYVPKGSGKDAPTIFWRTPYNFNKMSGTRLRYAVEAVSRGFAFVLQDERGRYFSEGKFQILGYPRTDGFDSLDWIADQKWSNGKVGTLGCSSSAEWQLSLAAQDHPAHAAMVPMASGAGIGRVGDFQEQGNWYTGGVPRTLFFVWLYNVDNPLRAQIPAGLDAKTRARIGEYNDLAANKPDVDWKTHIFSLPINQMLSSLGEPPATFEQFIARKPNDQGWFNGGIYHDNEPWGVPALWFNSWYDVSIGPNMALFNHARKNGVDKSVRENQYAVVAPVTHCGFLRLGPDTKVGGRNVGDTSFDTMGEIFSWFDRWLKDDKAAFAKDTPHVRYYAMGTNKWQSADQWPPKTAKMQRLYLHSGGKANSLYGDGTLRTAKPENKQSADSFTYDPMNPVPTIGGGDCCNGGLVIPGAFDQRSIEARADVLVYTSQPLDQPMEVSGFVDAVLYVSSDVPDTDFAVKLVDVTPDGTAYIIDDTILRARYRNGFDQEEFLKKNQIAKLEFSPMTTSIVFGKGHRIRVEVTSSNFPKFVRNLNTGGANYDESKGAVAQNQIYHTGKHASYIELPVVQ